MGLEHLLRSQLLDGAPPSEIDEATLRRVLERGRRRRRSRRAVAGVATVGAIVAALVFASDLAGLLAPPSRPAAEVPPYARIAGTYAATLRTADPDVAAVDVAGTWMLWLDAHGRLLVTPPDRHLGALSGSAFTLEGDRFETNVFLSRCNAVNDRQVGTYRWRLTGDRLVLELLDDGCAFREAILTSATWERVR